MNTQVPLAIKSSDSSVKIINDIKMKGYIHRWSINLGKMILVDELPLKIGTEVVLHKGDFLSYKDDKGQLVPVCGGE